MAPPKYQMGPATSGEVIGERLARNESDLSHLREDVAGIKVEMKAMAAEVKSDIKSIASDMRHVMTVIDQANGGWKAMLWVGGVSGTIGALLVKLVPWLVSMPK